MEPTSTPLAPLPSFDLLSADRSPYRTLVEALEYGVLLYDHTGRVLVHNRSAEQVLGLSAAEIGWLSPLPPGWQLFFEDGSPLTMSSHPVFQAFQTGRVVRDMTIRVAHPGGHSNWLQVSVQPLFDARQQPYAAVGSLIDITQERQAREQLERHNHFQTQLGDLVKASLQENLGRTFYQRLMEGAVAAVPGAQAGSLLLRGDDDRFYFAAAVNFDQQVLEHTYLHEHELWRDPTVDGPQLIYGFDNSTIQEAERRDPLYEAGDTAAIKVSLSVPIEVGGRSVAYFSLDNFDDPNGLGPDAVQFGQLFAHQVGALWQRFKLEADLKREQQALKQLAFFDPLTSLANRALLSDRLEQALLQSSRSARPVALIFLDLDNFKYVNDAFGHDAGDALLQMAAARLLGCVRAGDTVARWGGDEFLVLLPQVSEGEDAAQVARKILAALSEPFSVSGSEVYVSASLGLSIYPTLAKDADELIKQADLALYRVKEAGKQGFGFYADEMNVRLRNRLTLETELRQALSAGALQLRYRPRVDLLSGTVAAFAVHVTWPHPQQGLLTPATLLPLVEESGLVLPFCEQVLAQAAQQARAWQQQGVPKRVVVGVPSSFIRAQTAELVTQTLKTHALEPSALELSLYLGSALNPDALQALQRVRALGVQLSLQGFGAHNVPIALLRELPLQHLGIGPNIVRDLGGVVGDPLSSSLVQTALLLARTLGAEVFAQGVANEAQGRALQQLGCLSAQGPLFGEPLSGPEVSDWLRSRPVRPLRYEL